jgi:exopolysaccharide biosynthesis polyprenyl glycosylphosphotransferase
MKRVLIVGTGPLARAAAANLREARAAHIVGALSLPEEPTPSNEWPILGTVDDLPTVLVHAHIDEVYLAGDSRYHHDSLQEVVAHCERVGTPFALPVSAYRHQRALLADSTPDRDGFLHYTCTLSRPWSAATKRAIDVCAAAAGLLILAPILAVIALAVRVDSRGAVLFRQVRVGRNGRLFSMLKFRSMRTDAEALLGTLATRNEQDGPVFKLAHDPRVTRVGEFIRRYSLDELPQLWNVFVGDMSLVGPRPPLPREVARYEPWQRRRLSMRPGITCLWQVSGRNDIRFEQWMYLDLQYVDQWSLWSDVRVLWRTIPAVLFARGAS